MSCPLGINTGIIQLVGPIQSRMIDSISNNSNPLTIAFAPRISVATLIKNKINESNNNTCTYRSTKFSLVDVQICSVIHTGYIIPGMSDRPKAELILSFYNSSTNDISGILLCIPIYTSSTPQYNTYLTTVINQSDSADIPTLETIFYNSKKDTNQHSFAYKTCFETQSSDNSLHSKYLYIHVFPKGIHLDTKVYYDLSTTLNNLIPAFTIPPAIRGGDKTVQQHDIKTVNQAIVKTPTELSSTGEIYKTNLSTTDALFINTFEYFTSPPRLPISNQTNSDKCPYYKTNQYKCVPFNQLTDLDSSNTYVVPGSKSLDTILEEKNKKQTSEKPSLYSSIANLSPGEIDAIAGSTIGFICLFLIVLKVGSVLSKTS